MAKVSRSALVPYSISEMYSLVDKIETYPEFLPWCSNTIVHLREGSQIEASIEISKGALNKSFRTRNQLIKDESIEMELVDGPFKYLHGFWRFEALKEDACKVSLDLDYEFASRILSITVGPVFNQVANTLVDSFVERAREVYGKR